MGAEMTEAVSVAVRCDLAPGSADEIRLVVEAVGLVYERAVERFKGKRRYFRSLRFREFDGVITGFTVELTPMPTPREARDEIRKRLGVKRLRPMRKPT